MEILTTAQHFMPLTYGLMHFVVAIGAAFALTGSWAVALGIGMVEPLIQTIAYTLHEKAWAKAGINAPQAYHHHHRVERLHATQPMPEAA